MHFRSSTDDGALTNSFPSTSHMTSQVSFKMLQTVDLPRIHLHEVLSNPISTLPVNLQMQNIEVSGPASLMTIFLLSVCCNNVDDTKMEKPRK